MAKFKFKLEALLKVREFKEKKIKIELGEILKEIATVEERIKKAHKAIDETYEAQEAVMKDATAASLLQFFPYFVEGKKEEIKNAENLLWALRRKYDSKISELALARGEVKIMENFKDKKKTEWTKQINKKEQENIDELLQIRRIGAQDG